MRLRPAWRRLFSRQPSSSPVSLPSSLFARMAMILFVGLATAQLVSLWLQWDERATVVAQARGLNFADRMIDAVRVLEASPPAERAALLASFKTDNLSVKLLTEQEVSSHIPRGSIQTAVAARLGGNREIRSGGMGEGTRAGAGGGMGAGMGGSGKNLPGAMAQHGSQMRSFDLRLLDGQWVRIAETSESAAIPALSNDLIVQLLITLLVVTIVVMIAVRQATLPLKNLAQAADNLGRNLEAPPLPETGPTEMQAAAKAFNHMQARIRRLIDERARALAAVSHDLRTPLTRLRLRAELVDDDNLREQMAADLETMATMLDTTLSYLRGLQESEAARPIDMNALLQSLIEDAAVLGREINLDGNALVPYTGRLSALRRALQNLIDNAIKYGHGASIRVEDDVQHLRISVEDHGPGIPVAELARVTAPYYRPDASRSLETGGVGLGLSIVSDIALLHGGELQLANRAEGGLRATLLLPRHHRT